MALTQAARFALEVSAAPAEQVHWGDLGESLVGSPVDAEALATAAANFDRWPDEGRLAYVDDPRIPWEALSSMDDLQFAWLSTGWPEQSGPWLSLIRTLRADPARVADLPSNDCLPRFGLPEVRRFEPFSLEDATSFSACLHRLPRMESLGLRGMFGDRTAWWKILPLLTGIRTFDGSHYWIGDGIRYMRSSALPQTLHALRLRKAQLLRGSWSSLARWPTLELNALDVSFNEGTASQVTAVIRSPAVRALTSLSAGGNAHDDDTLAAYSDETWPSLEQLALDRVTLGEFNHRALRAERLRRFVSRVSMPALRRLSLCDNRLDDGDCRHVIESEGAARLTRLELRDNCIGADGASHLLKAAPSTLSSLDLRGNPVRVDAREALVRTAEARGIRLALGPYSPPGAPP